MKKAIIACSVALALSACGASGTSPIQNTNPASIPANVLQFKVGTANLYGVATALNVVVTYRQPAGGFHPGDSGALVSSPQLNIPGTLAATAGSLTPYDPLSTAYTGPSQAETLGHSLTSTSQAVGAANVTTFGQSGGAFGIGIEPYNYVGPYDDQGNPNNINTPFTVNPYPVPLYNPVTVNPYVFMPWGGPPAFDLAGNGESVVGSGTVPAGTAGIGEGIDVIAIAPTGGAYSLTVGVAGNSGYTSKTANASLGKHPFVLGAAAAPTFAADGNGGGGIGVVMPAGAIEAYAQVTDYGPAGYKPTPTSTPMPPTTGCNGAHYGAQDIYYTVVTHANGVVTLPDAAGPGGSPTICNAAQNTAAAGSTEYGDTYTVQIVGFDYHMYEASYPASYGNPTPNISGTHGSTDNLSISPMYCAVAPPGAGAGVACAAGTLPIGGGQPAIRRGGGHARRTVIR